MSRNAFFGIMLVVSIMLAFELNVQPAKCEPRTIIVPDDYAYIQEAINAAGDGDTIQVSAGTYRESLYINKTLTLTGENKENTILDGKGGYSVIEVNSTAVVISGFTIINGSNGILLEKCDGSILKQNYIDHCSKGIWLQYSNSNTVSENILSNSRSRGILLCGHSSKNTITRNTIKDNGNGLGITGQDNLIYHNNFQNNQNQTLIIESFFNAWNNTCEGNYWSDYDGAEFNNYGIGNTPYVIDANNQDNCPLMSPYMLGDVNHDAEVSIVDIYMIAKAFQSEPGDENWNCHTDFDENSEINISDLYIAAREFGNKWQSARVDSNSSSIRENEQVV